MKFKLLVSLAIKKNYSYLCQLIDEKFNFKISEVKMEKICKFLYTDVNMMFTEEFNKKIHVKKDIFLKLLKSNNVSNCIIARCIISFYFIYFYIITDIIDKIDNLNESFRKNKINNDSIEIYMKLIENINFKNIDFENFLFLIKSNNFSLPELFKTQMNY